MRVCPEHALQLNYRKNKEALKAQRKAQKKAERKKLRLREDSGEDREPADTHKRSKRRKEGAFTDLEELDGSGEAPDQASKLKPSNHLEGVAGAGAYQQERCRLPRQLQDGQRDEGNAKPDLNKEADDFLHEMFP